MRTTSMAALLARSGAWALLVIGLTVAAAYAIVEATAPSGGDQADGISLMQIPLPLTLLALIEVAGVLAALIAHHVVISRAIRHDVLSLHRLVEDMRAGSVRVAYPVRLAELAPVFARLRQSGKQLVQEKDTLKELGLIDDLSQLSNRRHFEAQLQHYFHEAKVKGPSSTLIIDIDAFRHVREKYGHAAGDALIRSFAKALRTNVRPSDFVARLSGDLFCVIFPYTPLESARIACDRLRRELPRQLPLTNGVVHQLRWTGGVSAFADSDKEPSEAVARADRALLLAKKLGGNNTQVNCPARGLAKEPQIMSC
jgi:diguanylate cyclase (GGDEF)-like protein